MTVDLLQAESRRFAQQTQDLIEAVLPIGQNEDVALRTLKVIEHGDSFAIRPGDAKRAVPIWLLKDGERVAELDVSYLCALDRSGGFLAVRKSKFQLTSVRPKEGPPLLRFDFDHKSHSVPSAHWNVHGERGATSVLLSRCNPGHEGLLSQVHLPVGGVRYRPCLGDFLELLITEFNFDAAPQWRTAVQEGRATWRKVQARATVRDLPEEAAAVLVKLGYTITPPKSGHAPSNDEIIRCR